MKRTLLTGLALAVCAALAQAQGPVLPPGAQAPSPTKGQPASKAQAQQAQANRQAQLNALAKGKPFAHGNETYQFLLEVRAAQGSAPALQAQGVAASTILESKGPFQIFRAAPGSGPLAAPLNGSPLAVAKQNGAASFPVALNTRTGNLAIVNGQISVNLARVSQAGALASAHGLRLVRTIPVAKLAVMEVTAGQDPQAVLAALQADSRVAEAHLDMLEHLASPQ